MKENIQNRDPSPCRVGIIGITGRMGKQLAETLNTTSYYRVEAGVAKRVQKGRAGHYRVLPNLCELFTQSELIVDFSTADLVKATLQAAIDTPKPTIICTTGWERAGETAALIEQCAQKLPLVIAPNTSLGACLQRYLAMKLASVLPTDYDMDIHEKHHRHKMDVPSGTATALAEAIVEAQLQQRQMRYQVGVAKSGERPEHFIGMSVQRCGQLPGEHEVSFTSQYEMLSVKHVSFSRKLFAEGVIPILDWLTRHAVPPGYYTMFDVLALA